MTYSFDRKVFESSQIDTSNLFDDADVTPSRSEADIWAEMMKTSARRYTAVCEVCAMHPALIPQKDGVYLMSGDRDIRIMSASDAAARSWTLDELERFINGDNLF